MRRGALAHHTLLGIALLEVAAIGALVLWLLRDPEPVFDAHTGALTQVDTLESVEGDGHRESVIRLTNDTGLIVTLAVRRPIASTTSPRPAFLILGGAERGRGAAKLLADTRGTIVAAIDYPFDGDLKAKGLAVLAQVPAIRRAFYATPPAVTLVLDYLRRDPEVDPARMELMGASFGAPFATIAAARDSRVTRLWIAHGGGRPYLMIESGLRRDVPNALFRVPLAALGTLLVSGPRFAPEHWIDRVAPRPVVMLNATQDERIPPAAVQALWDAAQAPKEQIWIDGPHMLGSRPQILQAIVDSVMSRVGSR
ncbi:MAG: alpha/beta hydrolase [Gemmatimonadetes bacterium]|nr:alpha/beta hydrolase [Gemmatimonadota bacterium]